MFSSGFVSFWKLLRRPRYIATDASGIAITTSSGSVAVPWADIRRMYNWGSEVAVELSDTAPQHRIELSLRGYLWRSRKELVQLIVKQAGLYQSFWHSSEFLAPAEMERLGLQPRSTDVQALADPAVGEVGRAVRDSDTA